MMEKADREKIEAWCEGNAEDFGVEEFFGLPAEDREACLKEMVNRERADLLISMKEQAPSSKDAKSIRKALHQLRSRGVRLKDKPEEKTFVLPGREESQESAYCTPVGAAGDQAVWLWRSHRGANLMFQFFLDDRRGFMDIIPARISRSRFDRMVEGMRKEIGDTPIIEIPPDHARRLIARAEDTARATGREPPDGYREAKPRLGPLPEPSDRHPVEDELDLASIKDRLSLLYEPHDLLEHPVFSGWLFSKDAVDSCQLKLQEAEASPLVMNEAQKQDRIENVLQDEARNAVESKDRGFWKSRLFENAYLLMILGEKDRAEQAAAVALALDDENLPPLFPAMMKRSFQIKAQEKKSDGKIIIP